MTYFFVNYRAVIFAILFLCLMDFLPSWGKETVSIQKKHLVIIVGHAGDQEHYESFWKASTSLYRACTEKLRYSDKTISFLFEDKKSKIVDGVSNRNTIIQTLQNKAELLKSDDELVVVIIGHCSSQKPKLNLLGQDISGAEIGELLNKVDAHKVIVVATNNSNPSRRRKNRRYDRAVRSFL